MVIVYTGNGKGKTSACVGQALRALGQQMRVAFAQFMKKDVRSGEQRLLETLPGLRLHIGGSGFFRNEDERLQHRTTAEATLNWVRQAIPEVDMVILDEALYALGKELLLREELEDLLALAAQHGTHVVLSGRGLPQWLAEQADLITDMQEVKHPWQQGVPASPGIEF